MKTLFAWIVTAVFLLACAGQARLKIPKGGAIAKAHKVALPGGVALSMSWIAPGTFVMGSPEAEKGRKADELLTTVTLSDGYWIGATEVTIGQWKAVMGTGVRGQLEKLIHDDTVLDFGDRKQPLREFMRFDPADPGRYLTNENDELPMYFVSWNDAMAFCDRLNLLEKDRLPAGYRFSLPTEAQWEYACRAGSGEAAVNVAEQAWYNANSRLDYTGKGLGNPPAGSRNSATKAANAWGLYDMLGNLWEWCFDLYAPYPGGSVTDPVGSASGVFRVNRGGSWGSGPNDERAANRAKNPQPEASAYRGFRVALRRT